MSTFAAPLRVFGNTKEGASADVGDVIAMQTNTIDFNDTTKNLFWLPPNAQVIDFNVDITTAFDAGTTNTLDLGTAAIPTLFADDLALGAAVRVLASSDASQLPNYTFTNDILTVLSDLQPYPLAEQTLCGG